MPRILTVLALALGLSSAATGVTITGDTDSNSYFKGQTITVTTTLTTTGAEAPAHYALLELLWNDALMTGSPGPTLFPTALTSLAGLIPWSRGPGLCLSASCLVLDQFPPFIPDGFVPDPAVIVSTLTMVASAVGMINFSFGFVGVFGATPTLGPSAATARVIPEPGTAALLGLGLGGLALAGLRRRS